MIGIRIIHLWCTSIRESSCKKIVNVDYNGNVPQHFSTTSRIQRRRSGFSLFCGISHRFAQSLKVSKKYCSLNLLIALSPIFRNNHSNIDSCACLTFAHYIKSCLWFFVALPSAKAHVMQLYFVQMYSKRIMSSELPVLILSRFLFCCSSTSVPLLTFFRICSRVYFPSFIYVSVWSIARFVPV